jgi:hypothetical protein
MRAPDAGVPPVSLRAEARPADLRRPVPHPKPGAHSRTVAAEKPVARRRGVPPLAIINSSDLMSRGGGGAGPRLPGREVRGVPADRDQRARRMPVGVRNSTWPQSDASARYEPTEWAKVAIGLYHRLGADRVVAEVNYGGAMVEATLRAVDPNVAFRSVNRLVEPHFSCLSRGVHPRENTGDFVDSRLDFRSKAAKKCMKSVCHRPISLRILTGNFGPGRSDTKALLRYCRPGVLPVNPARRNASAIASPLAGAELLRPARISAGRRRLSDLVGAISARAVVGRASGA